MKTKKITKFISGILVFLMVFNFSITSFASNTEEGFFAEIEERYGGGEVLLDGIVGTLTSVIRIPIIFIGDAISVILGVLGKSAGVIDSGGATTTAMFERLSPEDVLFNRLHLVSLNFFDVTDTGSGSASGAIAEIRKNVAIWYYAIRNIALGVLLCIFIYVAIRMILSTVASDKAVYKKMLQDWLVGIVLLFMLHYIIVGSIMLNNVLVEDVMGPALTASSGAAGTETLGDFTSELREQGSTIFASASRTWGAAIVYIMVVFITLTFLYKYIMRMLTIGFLIIISPLITITYSIDKMGDGKSQALNTWLKEFEYNILIQPFHCIMYMVFVKTAVDILDGTLAAMVLAILCMKFIWDGEKIIKNIFGFNNAKSVGDSLIAAGGAITAMKTIGGMAKSSVGAAGGGGAIKGTGGNGGGAMPAGGNAALAASGQPISGSAAQTPRMVESPVLDKADEKAKKQPNAKNQELRKTMNDPNSGFFTKVGAGAQLGARNAGAAIAEGAKEKYQNGVNTIKGFKTNPGLTARGVMKGSLKMAFAGVAAGAALATGNLGYMTDAVKAGWAIGGVAAQKADKIPARMARMEGEANFRENAKKSGENLRSAGNMLPDEPVPPGENATDEEKERYNKEKEEYDKKAKELKPQQDELEEIKGAAANLRRDEHGKRMNSEQAFGEESIDEMIQDYKEHGSQRVNEQYSDAVSNFHETFGEAANAKNMLELGNMDAKDFRSALLNGNIPGIGELSKDPEKALQQKAAAYNLYDASQRKNLIDNADRMQGEELRNQNPDAQKDVAGYMRDSIPQKQRKAKGKKS